MATMYVAWHKYATKVIGDTTMQTEGPFIASETINIAAGGMTNQAPAGAEYATVWSDVAFWIASGINPTAAAGGASEPYPANEPVQVPAVVPYGTQIAGIAL